MYDYIMTKLKDLTGQQFTRLTVLYRVEDYITKSGIKQTQWLCQCSCGNKTKAKTNTLTSNRVKSCGCLNRELAAKRGKEKLTKHGYHNTPEYKSWQAMKQRCLNKNSPNYPLYGGRGITICNQWLNNFETFLSDLGKCPPNHVLDRIDNEGHYEPNNCIWSSKEQSALNSRTALGSIPIRGVHKKGNKYTACIQVNKKQKKKSFNTLEEAVNQRKQWEKDYGKHFTYQNY